MKIAEVFNRFAPFESIFQCPLCCFAMSFQNENSLVCSNRHCFDLSKHGYINFLPAKGGENYPLELFEARRRIFSEGFYTPISDIINKLIGEYSSADKPCILDAGCGEGYFASKLKGDIFPLDISKDAVVLAAKSGFSAQWMVGDLSRLPVSSGVMDIVVNIFSPANYQEFNRVLKSDGIILKVIPSQQYLIELRERSKHQLSNKEYSNIQVLEHFKECMDFVETQHLSYTLPVTAAQAESFARMTPMLQGVDISKLSFEGIDSITIAVEVLVGKRRL